MSNLGAEWKEIRFGECVKEWAVGPRFSGELYDGEGNVATLRTTDMNDDGGIDLNTMPLAQISPLAFSGHFLEVNDLVISRSGTCGITGVFNGFHKPVLPGAFLIRFRLNERAIPVYIRYLFNSGQGRDLLTQQAEGGVQKNIRGTSILRLPLRIPPVNQQRKIARILTTLDNVIAQTEALIAKYQAIKQGLMHDLFTRGVDATGKLRPPQSEAPELYKQSDLGWIPKEWEVVPCDQICHEIVVGIVVRPTDYYEVEGVPVLRSANVREDGLRNSDLVFMSEQSNRLLAKSQVFAGNVLTVRTGYPGTSCVVTKEFDGANCVDILISRPSHRIDPHFLAVWINSEYGKNQVLRKQGGLAQQHFNVGELKQLLVVLPSGDEQSMILSVLSKQTSLLQGETASLEKSRLLKSGLMQDLLTGKVLVKADESEEITA